MWECGALRSTRSDACEMRRLIAIAIAIDVTATVGQLGLAANTQPTLCEMERPRPVTGSVIEHA